MATTSRAHPPGPPAAVAGPEPIGPLLARLRLGQGFSQLRLAELLCAAAGTPTVTRHEVSRWERGDRVPGPFWLGWLAVVLQASLEHLEAAAAQTRSGPGRGRRGDPFQLWRPPAPASLLAELDHAPIHDLPDLAHAWLTGPERPAGPVEPGGLVAVRAVTHPGGPGRAGSAAARIDALATRLRELRRCDDLVGGLDLAGRLDRELREAIDLVRTVGDARQRRRALRVVAGLAQLTGWAQADAAAGPAARRAYRVALRAATAADDRPLAAHVLGSLSHLSLAAGDPREALLLARTGHAGARAAGSPWLRALLLHRMALAAARLGERRTAELALATAERAADRPPTGTEAQWLYWLDPAELAAMTGRCWAVLGRPLRAARLLAPVRRPHPGDRAAAVYATWLARSYLAVGEVEQAARVAAGALRSAVAAGSARAADGVRHLHPLLLRHRDVPLIRRYERLAADAGDYLPGPALPRRLTRRRASVTG